MVLLFCSPARAFPQTSESPVALDLHAYEAQLDRASQLVQQIKSQPGAIANLRQSLPDSWLVDTGHTKIRVPTDWLDAQLAEIQVHPEKASSLARIISVRLAAMRQSAIVSEQSPDQPSAAARGVLAAIFQRREFRGLAGPSDLDRWMQRAGLWLASKIAALLQHLHIQAKGGNALAWIVIALAFSLLCYWAYRSLSKKSRVTRMPKFDPVPPREARLWLNDAMNAAERGDYREAIHCGYWAAIARLEDTNVLPRDPARTPREALRLMRPHAAQHTLLQELTRHFEMIWYGSRPASLSAWASTRIQLEQMGCLKPSTAATANS